MLKEYEWKEWYHPLQQKVFIIAEDGKDYIVLVEKKIPKDQIYESKEAFKNYISPWQKK